MGLEPMVMSAKPDHKNGGDLSIAAAPVYHR
jgi:hypothetical protein